jgi:hypothetical protein
MTDVSSMKTRSRERMPLMTHVHTCIALGIATLGTLVMPGQAEDAPRLTLSGHIDQKPTDVHGMVEHDVVDIDVPTRLDPTTSVMVMIEGEPRKLELFQYSLRSLDFDLIVHEGDRMFSVDPPEVHTYRGTVRGLPGSEVRATLTDRGLFAKVEQGQGMKTWWIQPVHTLIEEGYVPPAGWTERSHVVMSGQISTFLPGYRCGNELMEDDGRNEVEEEGGLAGDVPGNRLHALAACADYEYFQKNGSSVDQTLIDIEMMTNFYESVYEKDAGFGGVNLNFELSAAVIYSTPDDPYEGNDIGGMLNAFGNDWNQCEKQSIFRHVAILHTGKPTGGTIGLAWVGVVCTNASLSYNVCQSLYTQNITYRTSLGAHELGHNYSSSHCNSDDDCRIMCSGNGACGAPTRFGDYAQEKIEEWINDYPCGFLLGDGPSMPFLDEFIPDASAANWTYGIGAVIAEDSVNPPSGPYTLRLSGTLDPTGTDEEPVCPDTFIAHELRSGTLDTSSYMPLFVSFQTQFRGVDPGEGLLVEYQNMMGNWVVLDEILTATGETENAFTLHEYEMGMDAMSAQMRIRFTALVNDPEDYIHIDDVSIGDPSSPPPDNNECDTAIQVEADGPIAINLAGATTSNVPGCTQLRRDVWYYFTTDTYGTCTVSLCGSEALDTSLAVYNGQFGCPNLQGQLIACTDLPPEGLEEECEDDPQFSYSTLEYGSVFIRVGSFIGQVTEEDLVLSVELEPFSSPCPGDFNGDLVVDGADLNAILGYWGEPDRDLNGDNITDGADLNILLGNWGPCD